MVYRVRYDPEADVPTVIVSRRVVCPVLRKWET